jgi:hypothetical protein
MSLDAVTEQDAILERLSALCGGRVFDALYDEQELSKATDGFRLPYIVVTFGDVYPLYGDRSITGEEDQPHSMVVIIECWAPAMSSARATAGAARTLLVGWAPNDNSAQMRLGRGGRFDQRDSEGRPAMYMQSITAELFLNMSVDD